MSRWWWLEERRPRRREGRGGVDSMVKREEEGTGAHGEERRFQESISLYPI